MSQIKYIPPEPQALKGEPVPSEVRKPTVIYNEIFTRSQLGFIECQFTRFPALPYELRLLIWETSLKRNRIISARPSYSCPLWQPRNSPPYSTYNKLGKAISGDHYQLYIQDLPLPVLLSVSRESRSTALRFYRVKLPLCRNVPHKPVSQRDPWDVTPETPIKTCSLYFNPEYDFLNTMMEIPSARDLFYDVLHDFKAHDPKDIGISNLILTEIAYPTHVEQGCRDSVKAILTNLRCVWLNLPFKSRILHLTPERLSYSNRSMPIAAHAESFISLENDPRPIGLDLRRIPAPRNMNDEVLPHVRWQQIEAHFGVTRSPSLDFRYLKAMGWMPMQQGIFDRQSFHRYLARADACIRKREKILARMKGRMPQNPPRSLMAEVPLVAGFWLFPSGIIDKFDEINTGSVVDLTEYPPQLCVFDLP